MGASNCQLTAPLSLGGDFTIERAAELRVLLLQQWEQHAPQTLCLRGINDIDGAGLQLLLALKRQQPTLRFANPSPAVKQLFERLQLSALLEQ